MVGNDIVDHECAKKLSRWESVRFRQKMFSKNELLFLNTNESDFELIWRLWSMKESAYKIYVQQTGRTFRNPHQIQVKSIRGKYGEVTIANLNYHTNTISNVNYTYTEASAGLIAHLNSCIFKIPEGLENNYCHQKLLNDFAKAKFLNVANLQLKKNKVGVPHIFYKNVLLTNSVSISHHHKYGAVSFH